MDPSAMTNGNHSSAQPPAMQQPTNDNPSRTFQTLQSSTAASTRHQQYLCEEVEYFNPEFDAYLQKILWEDDDFVRAVDAIGDFSDLTLPTPMDNAVLPSENQSTLISPTPTSPASTSPTSGTEEQQQLEENKKVIQDWEKQYEIDNLSLIARNDLPEAQKGSLLNGPAQPIRKNPVDESSFDERANFARECIRKEVIKAIVTHPLAKFVPMPTVDWTCCNVVLPAKQTRCGKCHKWRGGKRVFSGSNYDDGGGDNKNKRVKSSGGESESKNEKVKVVSNNYQLKENDLLEVSGANLWSPNYP